jgi:hypothetical protein
MRSWFRIPHKQTDFTKADSSQAESLPKDLPGSPTYRRDFVVQHSDQSFSQLISLTVVSRPQFGEGYGAPVLRWKGARESEISSRQEAARIAAESIKRDHKVETAVVDVTDEAIEDVASAEFNP